VVTLLYEQTFYDGRNRRMCFEILDRLDFAVGRNQAADGTAFYRSGSYSDRPMAGKDRNESKNGNNSYRPPGAAFAITVSRTSIRIVVECQLIIFSQPRGDNCKY